MMGHPLLPGAPWDVRDSVPRRERLWELARAGWRIPRCGEFVDMARLQVPLVVYTDPYAHCGEGKMLWRPGDPVPDTMCFCTEYIRGDSKLPESERCLVIGDYQFTLEYRSNDEWRSNVGGTYELIDTHKITNRDDHLLRYPLFAVDYVRDRDGDIHAIDLNVCPGVPREVINTVGRETLRESLKRYMT